LREKNLTELETLALSGGVNIADGHARQAPSPAQRDILQRLPELYAEAAAEPASELDARAQRAFLEMLGQRSALELTNVLTCYSSSVAIEIVARSLSSERRRVGVIHPTFDNIPDILRGCGLTLVPLAEGLLAQPTANGLLAELEAVFVTSPNNPTGRTMSEQSLSELARSCARRKIVLLIDASFRGFDQAAQYDHCAVLERHGGEYVVMEDTGKLWPTLDLKAGFICHGGPRSLAIAKIHSDILLGISPMILRLIEELAADAATGGLAQTARQIADHRRDTRASLRALDCVSFPNAGSRVSVEEVALREVEGADVWAMCQRRGVHILPCRQFYWAEPDAGRHRIRIALGRRRETLRKGTQVVAEVLAELAGQRDVSLAAPGSFEED
jgi:enduracididine biosynthesis enzyme MppP